MLDYNQILTIIVSLLAIVVSVVSLISTNAISRKQIELQIQQTEFAKFQHELLAAEKAEKSKADVRISASVNGKSNYLKIENVGFAPAYDFVFKVHLPDGSETFLI